MSIQRKLTQEQFQRIVRAIADPHRYEILRQIHSTPKLTCTDFVESMGLTQPTVSHHLRELVASDLISTYREGRYKLLEPRKDIWKAFQAELNIL